MRHTFKKLTAFILVVITCLSISAMSYADLTANASGETFFIDPGHGGKDPGAISTDGTRYESHDVLRLSLRVAEIIRANGQTVALSRTTDVFYELSERSAMANKGNHKYLISIHRNSALSTTANGVETIYHTSLTSSSTAAKFATAVQNAVIGATTFRNRGVKQYNYHMVREPNMPSCLIEVGFMKNDNDHVIFDNYFEAIATAIAKAMLSMVGSGGNIVVPGEVTNKLNGNSPIDLGSDFYARIPHPETGKYVTDKGGNVELADYTGTSADLWHFMKQGNGAYLIGNTNTHGFWDVKDSKYEDGTNIISNQTVNYGNNQKFFIYYINKKFYFMPAGGDKTVDVSASTGNVQLYGSDVGTEGTAAYVARAFGLEIISIYGPTKTQASFPDTFTATIKNINSNKYITANGTLIIGEDENGLDNQKYNFTRQPNGSWVIESVTNPGKVFSVAGAPIDCSGVRVTLAPLTGGAYQTFFIVEKDGAHYIKTSYSYNALDMAANSHNINLHNTGDAAEQLAAQRYLIEIVDEDETELVLKSTSKYEKNGSELLKVIAGQTAEEVLANFKNKYAQITDANGNVVDASKEVGTGCTVDLVVDGVKLDTLTVVILGDVNGDGTVDATDYLRIKKQFLGELTMEGPFSVAADVDKSGKIDGTDYLKIKGHFIGSFDLFA